MTTVFRVFCHIYGAGTWECGDFATEDEAWNWVDGESVQPDLEHWVEEVEIEEED